jgi:hypothetical protein
MSTPHRATEEQWEIVEICREQGHTPWPTATCLMELRSRVEALERRCEVQLQQLGDLQDRHHRLAGNVRLLEGEVFTDAEVPDAPPPDPLINVTGKGVIVEGQFDYSGTTYVYRAKAQPALAVKDSLTAGLAGSLVERIEARAGGDGRAAIREMAAWLRVESKGHLGSGAHWAHRMEQEASR